MKNSDRIKLWAAINKYAEATGGNVRSALNSFSKERGNAVSEIESILFEIDEKSNKPFLYYVNKFAKLFKKRGK